MGHAPQRGLHHLLRGQAAPRKQRREAQFQIEDVLPGRLPHRLLSRPSPGLGRAEVAGDAREMGQKIVQAGAVRLHGDLPADGPLIGFQALGAKVAGNVGQGSRAGRAGQVVVQLHLGQGRGQLCKLHMVSPF